MADNYGTTPRFLYFSTPLGDDKLQLNQFAGYEAMSELFRYQLEFQAKNDVDVKFDQLIGKDVSFGVNAGDMPARHLSGVCIELSQGSRGTELTDYSMVVVARAWTLTQKVRSRIFQQKNVPDILKAVIVGIDVEYQFDETYEKREYCVQYQESDWDFVCRVLEDEGMYYYFKFTTGTHKLIVTDKKRLTIEVADQTTIKFDPVGGGGDTTMRIFDLRRSQSWRSGKVTLWDHQFQLPHKHNDVEKTVIDTITAGSIVHKLKLNGNDQFEIYEHPGDYAKWFDGVDKGGGEQPAELSKVTKENKRVADVRMQQEETQMLVFLGAGDCRNFVPGHKFTFEGHFNANGPYILTSVSHTATEGSYRSGRDEISHYENTFTCIPQDLKFRAPRRTPKPKIGCQTAVVVGPAGEEIFTDKYGRVKVQFHWDRDGREDAASSCWLRVATPWAGTNWGTIHIPRIKMEVLVDFLNSDPDRPIIIGSLYNSREMPPYALPDNKTQSGIKSRSSKGGGADNYNELRFEDKKGEEMITLHAEKDMEREVEHDDRIDIGNDQKIDVHHDRTEKVDNDEKIEIGNNRTNKIAQKHQEEIGGDHLSEVKMNKKTKVGMNYNIESGMNVTIKAGVQLNIESGVAITLKAGSSSIQINPGGIQISGVPMLMLNCPGAPAMPVMPVIIPPLMPAMPKPPAVPGMPAMPAMPSAPGMPAIPGLGPIQGVQMPTLPPMPALPDPGAMASQVTSMVGSALDTATSVLGNMSNTFMDQVTNTANSLLSSAQNLGQVAASTAGQIANKIEGAVNEAKEKIGEAVDEAKSKVEGAIDEVSEKAQEAVAQVAQQVSDLEEKASGALDQAQQQLQDVAAQAEQLANQAMEQGQQALKQASDAANQAAQQAQAVAQQAQQQLQDVAQQAEQIANDAKEQGQQALNAASQQLDALAKQGQQAAEAAQQAAQAAAQQAQQMAQEAMAQAEQAASQMAQQAQQAAQQAQQAAQQAAAAAQQAAQEAAANAQKMAEETKQQVEQAVDDAKKQVGEAAEEAKEQVTQATQQATQAAQEAGEMAQKQAEQVAGQVGQAASQAADQIGKTADQAFDQVGNTADQAAQGVQNAFKGR